MGTNYRKQYTGESASFVSEVLKEEGIPYTFKEGGGCFLLRNPVKGGRYQYYYTTGRWSKLRLGKENKLHYRSKGIYDFLERFFKWELKNPKRLDEVASIESTQTKPLKDVSDDS